MPKGTIGSEDIKVMKIYAPIKRGNTHEAERVEIIRGNEQKHMGIRD